MNKQCTKKTHYLVSAVVSGSLFSLASFLFTRHFRIKLVISIVLRYVLSTENDHKHYTHSNADANKHGRIVLLYTVNNSKQRKLLMEKE